MNKPVVIAPPPQGAKARFSAAEFLDMVEAGAFHDMTIELAKGELERVNPPMNEHAQWQSEVIFHLRSALGASAKGLVLAEIGIVLGDDTVRGADFALVRRPIGDRRMLRPDDVLLIGEVADETLPRDLGAKAADYATAEIACYWVLDVNARITHVMRDPAEGEYRSREVVRFGEPLAVPGANQTITLD